MPPCKSIHEDFVREQELKIGIKTCKKIHNISCFKHILYAVYSIVCLVDIEIRDGILVCSTGTVLQTARSADHV